MIGVEIDLENKVVKSSVSLSATYEELVSYYKGNDSVLSYTFPIMVFPSPSEIHKDRLIAIEGDLYFYTNYPWKVTLSE